MVAPGFPETVLQLFGFTVRQMDALFASYNMPLGGDLVRKREQFRCFIGVRGTVSAEVE